MSQNESKIDPGKGYRLLDKDEPCQEGDEFKYGKQWLAMDCENDWGKVWQFTTIRRRVETVEPKVDPGYGWRLLNLPEEKAMSDDELLYENKIWSPLGGCGSGLRFGREWTVRRRIEAPEGYRLVGENEKIQEGDYSVSIFTPRADRRSPGSLDLIGKHWFGFTGKELNKTYGGWIVVRKLVKSTNTKSNTYLLDKGSIIQAEDEQYLTREKMWVKVYPHNIGQKVPGKGAFRGVKVEEAAAPKFSIHYIKPPYPINCPGCEHESRQKTKCQPSIKVNGEVLDLELTVDSKDLKILITARRDTTVFARDNVIFGTNLEEIKKVFGAALKPKDLFSEPVEDGWSNGPQKPDLSKYPKWRRLKTGENIKPGDVTSCECGQNYFFKRPITPVTLERVPGKVFRQLEPHEVLSKGTDWAVYSSGWVGMVNGLHGEKAEPGALRSFKYYREIFPGDLAD